MSNDYSKSPGALSHLTRRQRHVTQDGGTEPAFRNEYWDNHEPGIYVDVVSGQPCSRPPTSTTAAPAGPASPGRSPRTR
ncbi:hypothetical protein GCM10025864_27030 [Luteimicrobium album]|uniref:peptide-methionine (R)-S-oxide reductase n=1 Tax=Luteimicrobium album TaxID=1054550 RepID=A0ABQ6I4Q1_9MICO|nr:hypothetical protein GCM10025864_27030 [Luteimicrobium album]